MYGTVASGTLSSIQIQQIQGKLIIALGQLTALWNDQDYLQSEFISKFKMFDDHELAPYLTDFVKSVADKFAIVEIRDDKDVDAGSVVEVPIPKIPDNMPEQMIALFHQQFKSLLKQVAKSWCDLTKYGEEAATFKEQILTDMQEKYLHDAKMHASIVSLIENLLHLNIDVATPDIPSSPTSPTSLAFANYKSKQESMRQLVTGMDPVSVESITSGAALKPEFS